MNLFKSYRSKILLMAVIPLLVLFVFINGIYYFAIDEIAVREKRHEMDATLSSYHDRLEGYFEEIESSLLYLAQIPELRRLADDPSQEAEVEGIFKRYLAQHDDLLVLAFGTIHGDYYYDESTSSVPSGFDPRTRPWYQLGISLQPGEVGYTDIYRYIGTETYILSIDMPIINPSGEIVGVLDIVVDLSHWIDESYDAQTQPHIYRPVPLTFDQAKASMMAQRGTRFEPELLDLFFHLIEHPQKGHA